MDILFSDNDIVVALKPAGVASQEAKGANMIKALAEEGFGEVFPVHRLDTATAGIMVYARNQRSAAKLSQQIADRRVGKKYYALVYGRVEPENGDFTDLLFHDRQKNKSYVVKRKRGGVKEASLSYETLAHGKAGTRETTLVGVTLHTGRTHQIRVQFSFHGFSLVGDGKYGAADNYPLMLFCGELSFAHPVTGERMTFVRDCPFSVNPDISG